MSKTNQEYIYETEEFNENPTNEYYAAQFLWEESVITSIEETRR